MSRRTVSSPLMRGYVQFGRRLSETAAIVLDVRRPERKKTTSSSRTEVPRLDSFGEDVEEDEAETLTCFDLDEASSIDGGELGSHG